MTEELKQYASKLSGDLKIELQAHANRIEARLHAFYMKALVAFAIIGLASAGGLLGFGIVLRAQSKVPKEIQKQRYSALFDNCLAQNDRHDNVIVAIDAAVEQTPPKQLERARKGAEPFKLILEAAVPYTPDCKAYAKERVTRAS